jgi:soluble lytic murein transglycosylase-like protein
MRRALLLGVLLAAATAPARAEIALLANGQTLKVTAWRLEGDSLWMNLKGGGEVATPAASVRGFVPDEILDEVAAAIARPGPLDLRALAAETATRHGLDPALVLAVISVESGFRPDAVSPKGAQGLMQLMPGTAALLGVRDAFDPAANLDGGARHLRELLALYGGDLRKALAAYNAGAGAVSRHGGVPPYRETQDYVDRVLRRYRGGS